MQPLLVSVRVAARVIDVCPQTLYRMRAEGQIVFIKIRRRTLVPVTERERIVGTETSQF